MRYLVLLLALAPGLAPAASERRSAPGAFAVESIKLDWHDGTRDRDIPAKIYFPQDATSACPVIVFSHGLGGSRDNYEYLGRHWASHGYVSVHIQHKGSDESVWRGTARPAEGMRQAVLDPLNAFNRPIDASFAIDQLKHLNATNAALRGRLDLGKIGVAGHSFGAWTTLAIAGQTIGTSKRNFADERVKAAIAMSAPVLQRSGARDYSKIEMPVLHMTGTADNSPIGDTPARDRRVPFDLSTNAPRYLITFKDGDHMIFSGTAGPRRNRTRDELMHAVIKASSLAFWDAYLRGEAGGKQWLTNDLRRELGTNGVLETASLDPR